MFKRMLGSQAFISVTGAVLIAVLAVVGYLFYFDPMKKTVAYCALMPDAVGLYAGNKVTMRGIPVGTVDSVDADGTKVKVKFSVDAQYPVYADAAATTVSDSIVADRNLAVLNSGKNLQRWDSSRCITKTLTPKSITETLTALADLSSQLQQASAPDALAHGLSGLDAATQGAGPQSNEIVKKLGSALSQPDADIGHLVGIFDAFASVGQKVEEHWGDLRSMLLRLGPALNNATDELIGPGAKLVDNLGAVLPMLNDLVTIAGDPIMRGLNDTLPLIRLLRANVGSLSEVMLTLPVLTNAARNVMGDGITYGSPRAALPAAQADQVCAALNAVTPGSCTDAANGMVNVPLVPLVLGMAGAR
ncbi:MlaD family protein [Nocardia seriolae]|uniref:Mce family protein n=1 Tax=Nocardia seriolae TaxID=37332 RepID=A0A0B8N208_9NOCA|nr:MlaD family protein [Nocardia seriolae]MTJ61343.1 MCE family protein [Nocardia seriolae]MTJ71755.1 MCE family protein [Nocardia seriolae]MTJ90533.1 MCE family protein [Nocardia seriolae]MTK34493.1 MCE family protein [Nocardia seriolae]MTK39319.1 MCE family protein [Nocardia seriolae]